MRSTRLPFTLIACGVLAVASAPVRAGEPLALGAKVPMADVGMKSAADGKEVTLAKASGPRGQLVVFTCNHCPYANAWEERIVALGNEYAKKGIGVVLVNSNDPAKKEGDGLEGTAARAKERGMTFPYAIDGTSGLARAFGATRTPEAFLFDKAGKLAYHGTIDDNHKDAKAATKHYLRDALASVAKGETPAVQQTKSLGCSIKFR